jgi:hypothetical protein
MQFRPRSQYLYIALSVVATVQIGKNMECRYTDWAIPAHSYIYIHISLFVWHDISSKEKHCHEISMLLKTALLTNQVQCVRKVAVHLQKVLEVMSASVYTGLSQFN